MSQRDRVLQLLSEGWTCGTTFLDERMPRYGARIFDLRRRGFLIVRRPCADPSHRHESRQEEWRLIAAPDPDGQVAALLEVSA